MREILFRGKRVDNGEWVEGYFTKARDYLTDEKEFCVIFPTDLTLFPHSEFSSYEEVIPKTVGQYTGLKDIHGTKIFEGDIVDTRRWYVAYAADVGASYGMTAGWYIQRDDFESWAELECVDNYEVLGNIHDNPELLDTAL